MDKKEKYTKLRKDICWYYVAMIFFVLPLFFYHMYFNISLDKWLLFSVSTLIAVFLILCTCILEPGFSLSPKTIFKDFGLPEYALLMLLAANTISFIASVDTRESLSGTESRHHGYLSIVLYVIIILLLRKARLNIMNLMEIFSLSGFLVCIVTICQFLSFDFLGLYKGVTAESVHRMISTIGNMNIFSSFLCMLVPITLWLYLSAATVGKKLLYCLFFSVIIPSGIAGTSDSFWLGLFASIAFLFIFGGMKGKNWTDLAFAGICSSLASYAFLRAALYIESRHIIFSSSLKELDISIRPTSGITAFLLKHSEIMLISCGICVALFLLFLLLFGKERAEKVFPGASVSHLLRIFATCAFVLLPLAFIIAYPFNNNFGSFRGFIWNLGIRDFLDADFFRKIYGFGQETVLGRFRALYYDEMIQTTGVIYDNLHCELLQYLNTTGLFGLGTYLLSVFSIVLGLAKKIKDEPQLHILLLPILTYFLQSLVNIAQSATTPLFFLILGLGLMCLRNENKA